MHRAALLLIVAFASACTVLSGWGDLQEGNGKKADAGASSSPDATTNADSGPAPDAGTGTCAAQCAPRACCASTTGAFTCADKCEGPGAVALYCSNKRDCPNGVCCFTPFEARCAATCSSGLEVCDGDAGPGECGARTCAPFQTLSFSLCQ